MFQTEIIRYLQSFESAPLNVLFGIVNLVGYSDFYIALLIIIMFGINFRKGFYLMHVLIWTGVVTTFLKEYFALPRPCDVDSNVKLINKDYQNPTKFESMGARHFLGGLPYEVVKYFRNVADYSYGLPSGHVSSTTALWVAISQLFQQWWVKTISIALVILMPITRMYLGRHFLVDVLGGLFVGVFFVFLFDYSAYKAQWIRDTFSQRVAYFSLTPRAALLLTYFFIIPFIVYWILPQDDAGDAGNLLGINFGFMLLTRKGIPLDAGTLIQKITRILVAVILFFGINSLLKNAGLDDLPSLEFIRTAVVSFIVIYVTTELGVKLGFYDRVTCIVNSKLTTAFTATGDAGRKAER